MLLLVVVVLSMLVSSGVVVDMTVSDVADMAGTVIVFTTVDILVAVVVSSFGCRMCFFLS